MQNSFEGFIMKKIKKKLKIMTTLFLTSVLITFSIIVHIINSKQSSLGFKKKKKKKKKPLIIFKKKKKKKYNNYKF